MNFSSLFFNSEIAPHFLQNGLPLAYKSSYAFGKIDDAKSIPYLLSTKTRYKQVKQKRKPIIVTKY